MSACETCDGSGLCPDCGGEGWVETYYDADPGYDDAALRLLMHVPPVASTVECESCNGLGKCVECESDGRGLG